VRSFLESLSQTHFVCTLLSNSLGNAAVDTWDRFRLSEIVHMVESFSGIALHRSAMIDESLALPE
jgi:hypothetical protein